MKSRCRRRATVPAHVEPLRALFVRRVVWLGLVCMPALAQDATVSRPYHLVPTVNVSAQLINVRSRDGPSQPAELVMQLGPGLQLSKQSGRIQGTLDYQMLASIYSRQSERNTVDNNLAASGRAEAVPGWMYVDARATIGKQSVSPLGQLSASGSLAVNGNQRESLNVQVSPYVRGELLGLADYELRLQAGATEVRGTSLGDSSTLGSSLSLASPRRGTVLGWGLQVTQDRQDFKGGRPTDNYRATASVSATPDPELALVARAGQESTNVGALERRTFANWGGGLRWTPTPRTIVSISGDRRYFGDSFQITLEHRLRRSAFRFTSTKDAVSGGQPMTLFDLYMLQYKSIEPDFSQRYIRVLELLRQTGQNPNSVVGGSFATSAVTLQRRDDLSYSYIAPRTTFTLRASAGTTDVLDNINAQPRLGLIKQRGLEASVAHRLTPATSATLIGSLQRNSGQNQPDSELTSLSLGLNTALNRQTTASVGARLGVYSGASNSNRETSLTGSLSMRF